jgi:hypothetical protein
MGFCSFSAVVFTSPTGECKCQCHVISFVKFASLICYQVPCLDAIIPCLCSAKVLGVSRHTHNYDFTADSAPCFSQNTLLLSVIRTIVSHRLTAPAMIGDPVSC